jgi:curli production assembly/transport component CsgG
MRIIMILCLLLTGCSTWLTPINFWTNEPELMAVKEKHTTTLPPPKDGKVVVAVYSFLDKTGQRKESANIAKFSTAVTQGGESILLKSLEDAGNGMWFRVVERVGLDNLLKERQLIRSARDEVKDPSQIGSILYAGMILEGAIVSYDTNIRTGGIGLRYMGIGPDTQYQEDMVTVSLRAISTQTGEVLLTVNVQKTILSYTTGVAVFKFFDQGTQSFENEIGATKTEPGIYALKSALDLAVEELIIQGEQKSLWRFSKHFYREY